MCYCSPRLVRTPSSYSALELLSEAGFVFSRIMSFFYMLYVYTRPMSFCLETVQISMSSYSA